MIFWSTCWSSHDFPAPASAGIIRCGRHTSAPPATAAAIQPRKRLPSSLASAKRKARTASAAAWISFGQKRMATRVESLAQPARCLGASFRVNSFSPARIAIAQMPQHFP